MEKTMRWWSECTASWREKWNTVRMERNRAREDANVLRQLLKSAQEELDRIRSIKHYVNGETPKHSRSPLFPRKNLTLTEPEPQTKIKKIDSETQTEESISNDDPPTSSSVITTSSSFSQLATEVEILTAKCEELEAAKDAAFDDVSVLTWTEKKLS